MVVVVVVDGLLQTNMLCMVSRVTTLQPCQGRGLSHTSPAFIVSALYLCLGPPEWRFELQSMVTK